MHTDTLPTLPENEKRLRRLLCVTYAGALAYMDDGEAQDSRQLPTIDFLRDSLDEIELKMSQRRIKELEKHMKDLGPLGNPYGFCPTCHAPGVSREKRPDGNDRCKNGHLYPSNHALKGV